MKLSRAFTLIELLVVVAVIAVLIAILLPSLGNARALSKATKCGAQMNSVGKAVASYLTENSGIFPPSYWYPNADGSYNFMNQNPGHPNGYAHWSSFLFNNSKGMKAFTCPEFDVGGLSRTNPGPNGGYWTQGQTDQSGATGSNSNSIEDQQAPFMAFTANAAILPRNKFTINVAQADGGTGERLNVFVNETAIKRESSVIMMTEFNNAWRTITAADSSGNTVIKSHRPVSPYIGAGGGTDEYSFPAGAPLAKTTVGDLYNSTALAARVAAGASLITDPQSQLNAVGRHHPGNFGNYGGTANFIYCDGHVERKNIAQTLDGAGSWEWGEAYYSLTGNNSIRN